MTIKLRKKTVLPVAFALTLVGMIGLIGAHSTKAHAVGFGGNGQSVVKWGPTMPGTNLPEYITFNPGYRNANGQETPQAVWYSQNNRTMTNSFFGSDFKYRELML